MWVSLFLSPQMLILCISGNILTLLNIIAWVMSSYISVQIYEVTFFLVPTIYVNLLHNNTFHQIKLQNIAHICFTFYTYGLWIAKFWWIPAASSMQANSYIRDSFQFLLHSLRPILSGPPGRIEDQYMKGKPNQTKQKPTLPNFRPLSPSILLLYF